MARVTIRPTDDALGVCLHPPWPVSIRPDIDFNPRTARALRRRIRVLFAGVIAEHKGTRAKDWNWAGFGSDKRQIADLALRLGGDGPGATEICDEEWALAQGMVERLWPVIREVADQLLEHRSLTGERLRFVVRTALTGAGDDDRPRASLRRTGARERA